ncbi:hypothetical protein ACFX13_003434 [Malus domestica]
MSGPSDRRFDLNLGEEVVPPSPDNIWHLSFISPTGPLTVGDSMMKNDMTAAVVARNLVTPKDNRLLSKRSDELAVKDSLALSVQCAGSVSNMAQRLFARTRQVESLAAEVMSLKQEIRGLKHENKQLHKLAHNYATNMKRKINQMQESDGQILLDHQKFVGLFQRHLPSSSGAVPRNEAPNDQPSMPTSPRVPSSDEVPNSQPPEPLLPRASPSGEDEGRREKTATTGWGINENAPPSKTKMNKSETFQERSSAKLPPPKLKMKQSEAFQGRSRMNSPSLARSLWSTMSQRERRLEDMSNSPRPTHPSAPRAATVAIDLIEDQDQLFCFHDEFTSPPTRITLNTTCGNFFTCTFTGHCAGVQKLAINVTLLHSTFTTGLCSSTSCITTAPPSSQPRTACQIWLTDFMFFGTLTVEGDRE